MLNEDGSGIQFLSEEQLRNFIEQSEADGYSLYQEPMEGEATYMQFYRAANIKVGIPVDKFSKPLALLPEVTNCRKVDP